MAQDYIGVALSRVLHHLSGLLWCCGGSRAISAAPCWTARSCLMRMCYHAATAPLPFSRRPSPRTSWPPSCTHLAQLATQRSPSLSAVTSKQDVRYRSSSFWYHGATCVGKSQMLPVVAGSHADTWKSQVPAGQPGLLSAAQSWRALLKLAATLAHL